jgi:cytochrome oxidase assembly protein ShyY1
VLDNQPEPYGGPQVGWRLLQAAATSTSIVVVDRGWFIPATQQQFNSAAYLAQGQFELAGVWQAAPAPRGWLRGPATTTAPNILTLISPTLVHPQALSSSYFVATTPTQPGAQPGGVVASRPPTRNPQRHLSYLLQWLGLALVFPVLCGAAWRRKAPKQRA